MRSLAWTRALRACVTLMCAAMLATVPTHASETILYSFDALGRLVQVARSGTVNNGASASYSYDRADNRTSLTVTAGTATLTLSPTSLPGGTVGTAYSQTITASGGTSPYTYSTTSGTLPAGLSLSSSGVLSGNPTTAGAYGFTITATDSASHTGSQVYSVTIASGAATINLTSSSGVNLRTIANNNGYTGSSSANYTFVVDTGVTITGNTGGGIGIDTGTWPTGVTLTLQINGQGMVNGGGGNGGNGGGVWANSIVSPTAGSAGGDAIQCNAPVSIVVNGGGTVQAGGGGGGGGGVSGYGAGGPVNGYSTVVPGGGGGGGAPNGAGGAGAAGYNSTTSAAGSAGTTSGGGAGGTNGNPGGTGGTFAAAGAAGTSGGAAAGGAGGAAGYAVRKNGTGCTVSNSGTVTGTVG